MVGGCIDQQAVFKVGVGLRGSGLMEHAGGLGRRVVHFSTPKDIYFEPMRRRRWPTASSLARPAGLEVDPGFFNALIRRVGRK
jgi:hypothetical protein